MPSTNWQTVGVALAALIVVYAVVNAQNVLFGVALAAVVYLVAWVIDRASAGNPLDDMSRERRRATGAVVAAVLVYSGVIVANLLLGVVVAATVFLVSWLTSPDGPVARWLVRTK